MPLPEDKAAREAAANFVMPFGKWLGKSLRDIADEYGDARYLDWVVGLKDIDPVTRDHLKTFLAIPWVARMVDEAVESRDYGEPPENKAAPRPWWEKG